MKFIYFDDPKLQRETKYNKNDLVEEFSNKANF